MSESRSVIVNHNQTILRVGKAKWKTALTMLAADQSVPWELIGTVLGKVEHTTPITPEKAAELLQEL